MDSNLIAALAGAIAGAAVSAVWELSVTGARERRSVALKFIQDYLSLRHELANVIHILENPELAMGESKEAADNHNRITNMGNWFEVMALCYVKNHLDRQIILDAGILESARRFTARIANVRTQLSLPEEPWPYICRMSNMHKY